MLQERMKLPSVYRLTRQGAPACLVSLAKRSEIVGQADGMSKAIHLINRREGSTHIGLDRWKDQMHGFRSCCWQLNDDQAEALIGGWLYLHGSKAEKSSFGGQILGFEQGDGNMADSKIILFRADAACRGQVWRGADHGMAYMGGVIDADLSHEQ